MDNPDVIMKVFLDVLVIIIGMYGGMSFLLLFIIPTKLNLLAYISMILTVALSMNGAYLTWHSAIISFIVLAVCLLYLHFFGDK